MTGARAFARVGWGLAVIDVVAVLVARLADPGGDVGTALLYGIGIASFVGVGALLNARVRANPIGAMLLAAGTVLVVAVALGTYADIGKLQVPVWPGSGLARTIGDAMFIYPIVIALIGIPLFFPDGRLPSRRFRWVVGITIANMVVWTLEAVVPLLPNGNGGAAIADLGGLAAILDTLQLFVFFATIVSFGGAMVAVWVRFRRGDPVQRHQVKWLVAAVSLGAIAFPASFVSFNLNPVVSNALTIVGFLALFALPVAIGIAILRYRLYEIDRIISRTLSYAFVTGVLGIVFVVTVLLLQAILTPITGGQTIAVAASTLAVFALFQPVLRGVRRRVDRRFDRARYDADVTVQTFAARLRETWTSAPSGPRSWRPRGAPCDPPWPASGFAEPGTRTHDEIDRQGPAAGEGLRRDRLAPGRGRRDRRDRAPARRPGARLAEHVRVRRSRAGRVRGDGRGVRVGRRAVGRPATPQRRRLVHGPDRRRLRGWRPRRGGHLFARRPRGRWPSGRWFHRLADRRPDHDRRAHLRPSVHLPDRPRAQSEVGPAVPHRHGALGRRAASCWPSSRARCTSSRRSRTRSASARTCEPSPGSRSRS